MIHGKRYSITKKIKIHTKPLREVVIPQTGIFVKETVHHYIFRGFKVRKSCVMYVEELSE